MSPKKEERAVHGCHCPGDMAVRMRKVMAVPRVGVRVCRLLVGNQLLALSSLKMVLRSFYLLQTTKPTSMVSFRKFGTRFLLGQ